MTETKMCIDCEEDKPVSEFNKKRANSYQSYCKPCHTARNIEWRRKNPDRARLIKKRADWSRKNPDRVKEHTKTWREANRARLRDDSRAARAKAVGAFVERTVESEVFDTCGGICGICGLFVDPQAWDVDHIVPFAHGGTHQASNVQVSHPACNARKGSRVSWSVYAASC